MSKHILAINSDIAKGIVVFGMVGEKCISTTFKIDELEELTDNYIKEHYKHLLDDAYQKGYTDCRNVGEIQAQNNMFDEGVEYCKTQEQNRVWEYAKKIVLNHDDGGLSISELNEIFDCGSIQQVFRKYTISEIIEKLEAYENEHKVDVEIKVGDEVINNTTGTKGILLESETRDLLATVIIPSQRWKTFNSRHSNLTKTGKHYDIEDLLKVMNG